MRTQLRTALTRAMRARDTVAVATLRSALAAIDNAEAVVPGSAPAPEPHATVAGGIAGLGAAEVPRGSLTDADVRAIVRAEVDERRAAADAYERTGHRERAERLRSEAATLAAELAAEPR